MGLLKNQQLRHLTKSFNPSSSSSSSSFLPPAISAIRTASSPQEALSLYKKIKQRRQRQKNSDDPFETHAAVFTIKACSRVSDVSLIRHLHAHLRKTNLYSHVYVATALLNGYVVSSFHDACLLYDEIPNRNVITSNTMITGYSRHGNAGKARSLFDGMPEKDLATWCAMIGGYMGSGKWTQGLDLFREMMKREPLKPDRVMLVTLLTCCATTGSMSLLGKSIHAFSEKNGWELNVPLGTALIAMYGKLGCFRLAMRVFDRMPVRDVMPWSAMICGLALKGHGGEALALFQEMKRAGVRPNEITFTGVLSACCHSGLVEEGQRNFHCMVEEFGFEPSIHHYGCMVDLLAKAGLLEEAYEIITRMRIEPNIIVLTSLLASCKTYKNFEVAMRVIDRVLEMVIPDSDGGVYTLVSDLYAMGGKWNDVERVRKIMDKQNVKKKRGSSLIELKELKHQTLCWPTIFC